MRKVVVFAVSAVLLGAAVFFAVKKPSLFLSKASQTRPSFALKGDPDAYEKSTNQETLAGDHGEAEGGRLSAAEEEYQQRAYPADEIPFSLTQNAGAAFDQAVGRGQGANVGQWVLVGPSTATQPGILNFTGADTITSGRETALAIDPNCQVSFCRLWVAAAGGGIFRTDNALVASPTWKFVSGSFGTNAIGALTYDSKNGILYAGTGEPNASADSEAGVGIYKSSDGGDTWSLLSGSTSAFFGRSISSIVVDPLDANTLYVGSTRGVRGVSSVSSGGATTNPPVAAPFGLYKSIDGGATFTFIWNGNGSARGVNDVELDPSNHNIVYAAAFQQGVWRSTDGGATFAKIFSPIAPTYNTDRAEFAVTALPDGKTRMYVGDGAQGTPRAKFFRTDDAAAAAPAFVDLTTSGVANYCTGQCWYDNVVFTPPGYPDIVYVGGSYQYGEYGGISNSRGLVLSTNAGVAFTDVSWDASSDTTPAGLHPDHHAVVVAPFNPYIFFDGSDGGLMRSSGDFKNQSALCAARGLTGSRLTVCQGLLSRVPKKLYNLNKQLSTLQFQSLSLNAADPKNLMGGTQDNGTFEYSGSSVVWPQIIYGDGGQSGFSSGNPALRFNTFTGQASDVNFQNGDPTKWVIATGPIAKSPEGSYFYPPVTADPNPTMAGTIFQGSQSVWRTQDWAGNQAYLEANCPEFTTAYNNPACGDFVQIGPAGATDLTAAGYGNRDGGYVAAIERAVSDTGTLWVATGTGRVFISKNADAADASSVTFIRLDSFALNAPGRFVSSIYVDPANPNHAWISYSGYNINTPAQPGHVFEVTYDPLAGTATWTNLDGGTGPMGDLPVTDLVRDDVTGNLYAATDFGVLTLPAGTTTWESAGTGLPRVEVAGLTIAPGARKLYAATHGRSAWVLQLP